MMKIEPAASPFHILCKPAGPACNIHCEYCFYLDKADLFPDTRGAGFRMSDETLEEFTRQYIGSQHPAAREVNFAWQGGEPTLLGVDFFKRAVELQKKYAREGMTVSNALQTNGILLDDEWGQFLHENKFLVGVSVDGPEDLHNRFRKDRNGGGTFSRVMAGLDALKKHNVEFNTLTVVQSDNGDHPERVYDFLKEIGSTFMQFIPIVEPEEKGVSYRTVRPRQWGDFMCSVFHRWRKEDIGKIYVQHFDMMLGIHMGYPSSLCVHSPTCGRAMAIEHNGNLYSCDHFVFDENQLGNIHQTSITEMADSPFQRTFGTDKSDRLPGMCRRCEYLKFCYGGCPSDRVAKTPSGEPGLNWSCLGYKQFYHETFPYFQAMTECLHRQLSPALYQRFLPNQDTRQTPAGSAGSVEPSRNAPCPCGSGKKYKKCCGKK